MEYRETSPQDNGFDTEADEQEAMHDYIQTMMSKSGPDDLLDAGLIIANICEQRALAYKHDIRMYSWYNLCAFMFRDALTVIASIPGYRPQVKLENPMLYYPTPSQFH